MTATAREQDDLGHQSRRRYEALKVLEWAGLDRTVVPVAIRTLNAATGAQASASQGRSLDAS